MERTEDRERESLLSPEETTQPDIETESTVPAKGANQRATWLFLAILLGIVFILDFGSALYATPIVRIYEDIICRKYYDQTPNSLFPDGVDIPEENCKIPPIQRELAFIRGLEPTFESICGLIAAIPLSMLADNPKYGRKYVMCLALGGIYFQLTLQLLVCWFSKIVSLRLVWLSTVGALAGGSNMVAAMVYTMIIDITKPDQRSTMFFRLQLIGTWTPFLLAPPISSGLMLKFGPWSAVLLTIIVFLTATICIIWLPETINFHGHPAEALANEEADAEESTSHETESSPKGDSTYAKIKRQFKTNASEFIESSSFVFKNPYLVIIICSSFLSFVMLNRGLETLLLYASKRFHMKLAEANLLNTIFAAGTIGTLFLLPFVAKYLTEYRHKTSQQKDFIIGKVSMTLYATSWFVIGLAPHFVIVAIGTLMWALGSGFTGAIRSLAASYVESHHQARLMTFFAIIMQLGNLTGSPLLAWLYSSAVSLNREIWLGLPFFILSIIALMISAALIFGVRLPEEGAKVIIGEEGVMPDEESEQLIPGRQ